MRKKFFCSFAFLVVIIAMYYAIKKWERSTTIELIKSEILEMKQLPQEITSLHRVCQERWRFQAWDFIDLELKVHNNKNPITKINLTEIEKANKLKEKDIREFVTTSLDLFDQKIIIDCNTNSSNTDNSFGRNAYTLAEIYSALKSIGANDNEIEELRTRARILANEQTGKNNDRGIPYLFYILELE